MKSKIFLIKRAEGLNFLDDKSKDVYSTLKFNTWYSCELKEPRNPVFHAKVFYILQKTLDNLPETSALNRMNTYQLLKAIQFEIGATDIIQKLNGEIVIIPKSIAFESMDNIEFSEIYKQIVSKCEELIGAKLED